MLNIGPQELLIILVIALIVVGPQRLPTLGRSIGRGLRELRKAQDEVKRTIQVNLDDEPPNGSSRSGGPGRRAPAGSADEPAPEPNANPGTSSGEAMPVVPDATPTASEPLPANEIREISRSLGRSLSELRRAKEEVQRSFRVDLAGPATRPSAPKLADTGTPRPAPMPSTEAPEPAPPAGERTTSSTPEEAPADERSAAPDRATD